MSMNYQHSKVMGDIKTTNEVIKHNYSTYQYMGVLDSLLFNALSTIIHSSEYADDYVAGLLYHYTENGRRKVSSLSKKKFSLLATKFLFADSDAKLRLYKKMRIERGVTSTIIKSFLIELEEYTNIKRNYYKTGKSEYLNKIKDIENRIYYTESIDLLAVTREAQYWYKYYKDFKNMILQKYMRLIVKQAQAFYSHNNSNITLDDLIQNYFLYASKAIDKLDQRKGTLTSYILNWLNHARNVTASNEHGTAFILPPTKRREGVINNISVSMEDDEVKNLETSIYDTVEKDSERNLIRRLAKIADPSGYARLFLGIDEILSKEDILKQKAYIVSVK